MNSAYKVCSLYGYKGSWGQNLLEREEIERHNPILLGITPDGAPIPERSSWPYNNMKGRSIPYGISRPKVL